MKLTAAQLDRAHGTLLATAAGDALGAPYEFRPARPAHFRDHGRQRRSAAFGEAKFL